MTCRTAAAALLCCALLPVLAAAQDPASSWLAYAAASCPAGTRVTHFEGQWKVPPRPAHSNLGTYYTPWIGAETTDNMNLLQPVSPWNGELNWGQGAWQAYNEYFQWSPVHNTNGKMFDVAAGDTLHGGLDLARDQSYAVWINDAASGKNQSITVPVQRAAGGGYKNYTNVYVVFEHPQRCDSYPATNGMAFEKLLVHCDHKPTPMAWRASVVTEVCEFAAQVVDANTVTMTWNSSSTKHGQPRPRRQAKRGL
jgi:hypothetical protein